MVCKWSGRKPLIGSSSLKRYITGMIKIIKFDNLTLVGKGLHRECYRHPGNNKLCIKILFSNAYSEVKREKKYYAHLQKRNISWEMIPRFYGEINTPLGMGYIFDLILDHDGSVAKTLDYYLSSSDSLNKINKHALRQALSRLKRYLLQQRIITMTLHPKNIGCQINKSGEVCLYIIDSIGNSDFIPLCNFVAWLARKKILRKWKRLEILMSKISGDRYYLNI